MKKVINEEDIRKATNIERCKMILAIIKGQAIYTQDIKTHWGDEIWKMKLEKLFIEF